MIKIRVGTDPEFMASNFKGYVYPALAGKDSLIKNIGCDEFGHCVEIRPEHATSGEGLVLNTMKEMAKLPTHDEGFKLNYYGENVVFMDRNIFNQLIRLQGGKQISRSENIYGLDILSDENCPADVGARKNGQRLLFCGMHMHISAVTEKTIHDAHDKHGEKIINKTVEVPIELPVKSLVHLFDVYIYDNLLGDPYFNAGRYRSRGFYEHKAHGGFEYRSLGASALTPERLAIVADMMIEMVENFDEINLGLKSKTKTKKLDYLISKLKATKFYSKELRRIWVPWD